MECISSNDLPASSSLVDPTILHTTPFLSCSPNFTSWTNPYRRDFTTLSTPRNDIYLINSVGCIFYTNNNICGQPIQYKYCGIFLRTVKKMDASRIKRKRTFISKPTHSVPVSLQWKICKTDLSNALQTIKKLEDVV